ESEEVALGSAAVRAVDPATSGTKDQATGGRKLARPGLFLELVLPDTARVFGIVGPDGALSRVALHIDFRDRAGEESARSVLGVALPVQPGVFPDGEIEQAVQRIVGG